jgi:DNA polymerase-3 subunit gamma/tau
MFHLKYRPKTVAEIDNSRAKEMIKGILGAENLPHAFLFIGQKGTGKTSTARILAKAVNCLDNRFADKKNQDTEPCNKCKNCKSISNSSYTDVLELDAASNRGIEEVKSLIRETAFLPMAGRYRVFIIDEAHMITPDGFNALLKTLEEPPSTAIFILATTNQEKIPKTIASRCIKINFGRAKKEDIVKMLKRYLKLEKISLDDKVLNLIATHSEHSFRDAAKILEELIMQKFSSYEQVEKFLGVRGKGDILDIIGKKDLKEILLWIEEFSQGGGDFKALIESMLESLRINLLMKKGVELEDGEEIGLTASETSILIKLLMDAYNTLRSSPIESLPLEIAVAEFYNKRQVTKD